jgi:hypothetical protein
MRFLAVGALLSDGVFSCTATVVAPTRILTAAHCLWHGPHRQPKLTFSIGPSPASPYDTLYFLHGPMESLDAHTGLLVFGDGREVALAQDVAAFGCPTVLVTGRSDVASADRLAVITVPRTGHAGADAIIQILPAQLLVAELADAAGLTDVQFRYRQTDTKFPPKAA